MDITFFSCTFPIWLIAPDRFLKQISSVQYVVDVKCFWTEMKISATNDLKNLFEDRAC